MEYIVSADNLEPGRSLMWRMLAVEKKTLAYLGPQWFLNISDWCPNGRLSLLHFSAICGIPGRSLWRYSRLGRTWLAGHSEWRHISTDFSRPRGMCHTFRYRRADRDIWCKDLGKAPRTWGKASTVCCFQVLMKTYENPTNSFAASPHFRRWTRDISWQFVGGKNIFTYLQLVSISILVGWIMLNLS